MARIRTSVFSWPPVRLRSRQDNRWKPPWPFVSPRRNTTSMKIISAHVLAPADFAHQVFGEVDSTPLTIVDTGSPAKPDTTYSYYVNHFVSPAPRTSRIYDNGAGSGRARYLGYERRSQPSIIFCQRLHKSKIPRLLFWAINFGDPTRSDHDSTIRPGGVNPDVMLGSWQLYDFTTDSVFDAKGHFNHFHYTRTNTIPNPIPHSYLDVGDDNHQGHVAPKRKWESL